MLKINRNVVPVPAALMHNRLRRYKDEIRHHFMLPPEVRYRRRPPYNDNVLLMEPEVRAALHTVFAGKCAYCETRLDQVKIEISHLRPPSNAASSHNEKTNPDYYAWLAYEWRNLLLLCAHCNRMKANLFPVEGPRALPLSTWNEAVAAEEALLLDPCVDEPRRHLSFTRDGQVHPLSTRGSSTIEVLGLNRLDLQRQRSEVFAVLVSLQQGFPHEEAIALLDAQRPHAGALRILVIGLCRAASQLRRMALPVDHRNLATSLVTVRALLSENEWLRAMDMIGMKRVWSDLHVSYDVLGTNVARNEKRKQPLLESILIEHFKGIDRIELDLTAGWRHKRARRAPCTMLLGENSVGKSSILQAVAMTLMDAPDRRAMRLDPEDFISRGDGSWQLTASATPEVTLRFEGGSQARLCYDKSGEHRFDITNDVPCTILAYGSRRFFDERGAKRKGARVNKTLFDPVATLADPGIWLRTIEPHTFDAVARAMREVLALRDDDRILRTEEGNVLVRAHGRESPVERMSDGYRSLFAMAIDIMRNMLETWDNLEYARGIVLIDEIETHLHPRWKTQVISALRNAMPHVQFIATTHDPLCLRGMKNGEVHVLYRDDLGHVRRVDDLPDIETLRAEQILTSDYFGLWTTADLKQETVLMRLAALGGRDDKDLSADERHDRDVLLRQFDGLPVIGSSPDRQILAEAMTRHLRALPFVPVGERAALREDAIDQIVGVLERTMRP